MQSRFVMIGDSLTREWLDYDPGFFQVNGIINAGVGGETTQQIANRLKDDALQICAWGVIIMAGTNDVAENGGAVSDEAILSRFADMVRAAGAAGVVPVICSLPPANSYFWNPAVKPAPRIGRLNTGLGRLARQTNAIYADYHQRLCDDKGGLRGDFTRDGVHLSLAGYHAIEPVASAIMTEICRTARPDREVD